jgi:hypothetical protein
MIKVSIDRQVMQSVMSGVADQMKSKIDLNRVKKICKKLYGLESVEGFEHKYADIVAIENQVGCRLDLEVRFSMSVFISTKENSDSSLPVNNNIPNEPDIPEGLDDILEEPDILEGPDDISEEPDILEGLDDISEEPDILEGLDDISEEPDIPEGLDDISEEPDIPEEEIDLSGFDDIGEEVLDLSGFDEIRKKKPDLSEEFDDIREEELDLSGFDEIREKKLDDMGRLKEKPMIVKNNKKRQKAS